MQNLEMCRTLLWPSVSGPPRRWRGGRRMETTMNVELINPAALVATLAGTSGGGRDEAPCRKRRARVGEEVRYPLALRELRRLDDRDLDDLDLGRGDLPGLARRHARETAGRARGRRGPEIDGPVEVLPSPLLRQAEAERRELPRGRRQ